MTKQPSIQLEKEVLTALANHKKRKENEAQFSEDFLYRELKFALETLFDNKVSDGRKS